MILTNFSTIPISVQNLMPIGANSEGQSRLRSTLAFDDRFVCRVSPNENPHLRLSHACFCTLAGSWRILERTCADTARTRRVELPQQTSLCDKSTHSANNCAVPVPNYPAVDHADWSRHFLTRWRRSRIDGSLSDGPAGV